MSLIITNVEMCHHNETSVPGTIILTFSNGEKVTYKRFTEESPRGDYQLSSFVQPKYEINEEKSETSFESLHSNFAIQLKSLEEQYKNAANKAETLFLLDKKNIEEYSKQQNFAIEQIYSTITQEMQENYKTLKKEIDSKIQNLNDPGQRVKTMISWLKETKDPEQQKAAQMLECESDYIQKRLEAKETSEIGWDCFLSHVQRNSAKVCRNISESLAKQGITSWLDKSADKPDKHAFIDGVIGSRLFVPVITKNYSKQGYCVFEYCTAIIARRPVITL